MSQTPAASTSNSNYQTIFDSALEAYKKKTKKDLRSHPLLAKLESCHSPDAIVNVLREHISESNQSRSDAKLTKWLNPVVNVLSVFSAVIGGGVSKVYWPARVIFTGIGVLLSASQAVSASEDSLANVFGSIENSFIRLETHIEVLPTKEMMDTVVKIMTEVLSILGIVTKEIKQSRARKFVMKLVGRTDIGDALARLDRLTQEEVWMAAVHTHGVDSEVQGVPNKMQGVDDKARGVDDNVDKVQRAQGVDHKVKDVNDKTGILVDGVDNPREGMQQVADHISDWKRNEMQRDLKKWLSPLDPSVDYKIASDARHEGTTLWFTESDHFKNWKASGSLFWIHGNSGSGKSVLSSSIIRDVKSMGSAYAAYFFFDFKDIGKQDVHALLASLVFQLSHQSNSFLDILFRYYSTHQSGSRKPSDHALTECLEEMFRVPGQVPIYLIVDALDESPNTTGMPSSRDKVLALIEKLVKLNLSNLRLCITSCPEVDIRTFLEPLATSQISLHDQSGQKKDIADFVKFVVNSDGNMRIWPEEVRETAIKTLSERADGVFRWASCQLEALRHCLPPDVKHILKELPETLDKTYERILEEIPESNRVHAHRLLQCLTVAISPLRVEDLGGALAVDFDAIGGIPKIREDFRWESQEEAVLSACSSLIAVVENRGSRIVQFSHFSVKEFLTSDRLSTSNLDVSRYHHIRLGPAHSIMAKACLGVLLRLDSRTDLNNIGNYPLARYADEHFVAHAEFGDVLSHISDGVDDLLDANKPHLALLRKRRGYQWTEPKGVAPLYYAAELGFRGMVQHLISKRPEDLNTRGLYGTPLHAALVKGHADVAQLLVTHCVDVDARDAGARTALLLAGEIGFLEVVRMLVERNADINARDKSDGTPLYRTVRSTASADEDIRFDVARFLLSHGAEPDARNDDHWTVLHAASHNGNAKAAQLLLEHGANINGPDKRGQTPLHRIVDSWEHIGDHYFDALRLLLDRGADVHAQDTYNTTPLHAASRRGRVKFAQLLLDHGANINVRDKLGKTPLHQVVNKSKDDMDNPSQYFNTTRLLIDRGADVHARDWKDSTPLHDASYNNSVKAAQLLLEHGADANVLDKNNSTPLHEAAMNGCVDVARVLLAHGTNVHIRSKEGETPFQIASTEGHKEFARLLSEHLKGGKRA